jgi:hypothetical protein
LKKDTLALSVAFVLLFLLVFAFRAGKQIPYRHFGGTETWDVVGSLLSPIRVEGPDFRVEDPLGCAARCQARNGVGLLGLCPLLALAFVERDFLLWNVTLLDSPGFTPSAI